VFFAKFLGFLLPITFSHVTLALENGGLILACLYFSPFALRFSFAFFRVGASALLGTLRYGHYGLQTAVGRAFFFG